MINCIHKNNTCLQPIIKFDFLHYIKKNCHQFGKFYYLLEIHIKKRMNTISVWSPQLNVTFGIVKEEEQAPRNGINYVGL